MSETVLDGAVVSMDPRDSRVFRFDWDTYNLATGVSIASQRLEVIGVGALALAVSGITRSGSVATVTTEDAHGLTTGDVVTLAGADQAEYNISATVTVLSTTSFSVAVTGTPTTPVTGELTYSRGLRFDNSAIVSQSPYDSRSTQVRLIADGPDFLGARFEIANRITTNESPSQTKERSFFVVIENL